MPARVQDKSASAPYVLHAAGRCLFIRLDQDVTSDTRCGRHVTHAWWLQAALWRLLGGVLWLGNLEFERDPSDAANDSTLVREALDRPELA